MNAVREIVQRHRGGVPVGIPSVCSAQPLVIRAALEHARAGERIALIEATCNQVNQEGGYTGLRPAQFRDLVLGLAAEVGLPRPALVLGGDHLGPNPWVKHPAEDALRRAGAMIAEYVRAGFRKIHIDCSMPCADDRRPLTDELIAERTARLCDEAERAWRDSGGEPPAYVIGSEVPTPGGAQESLHALEVTRPEAALATLAANRAAFSRWRLEHAWERVIGLVVQPGVEFDDQAVIDYVPAKARSLSASLEAEPHLVFEAHSTDYQTPAALTALVRDHFAILKVGPALTFALREAVWALDAIEREWKEPAQRSGVRETLIGAMHRNPEHWIRYYHGTGRALALELEYSLSDRIRYYWPDPEVAAAMIRLEASFADAPPPALLKQYLPSAHAAVRSGRLRPDARSLVTHHIRQTLAEYSDACDPKS